MIEGLVQRNAQSSKRVQKQVKLLFMSQNIRLATLVRTRHWAAPALCNSLPLASSFGLFSTDFKLASHG